MSVCVRACACVCIYMYYSAALPRTWPPRRLTRVNPQVIGIQEWPPPVSRLCTPSRYPVRLPSGVWIECPSAHRALACTGYSFSSRPLYKNQSYTSQAPPLFRHPPPPSIAHTSAHYCVSPDPPFMQNIDTILAMPISCKGQRVTPGE